MKNALNLTSKMPIVFNCSKVNGELLLSCRESFSLDTLNIVKQVTPITHSHSKGRNGDKEKRLNNREKNRSYRVMVGIWNSGWHHLDSKRLGYHSSSSVAYSTHWISWTGSISCLLLSSVDVTCFWNPQHLGPPPQIYTMISRGLLVGNLTMPHLTWPLPLSRTME